MQTPAVHRSQVILHPDRSRVLLRPFLLPSDPRAARICAQVMALPEAEVHTLYQEVKLEFGDRHAKTQDFLKRRFEQFRRCLRTNQNQGAESTLAFLLSLAELQLMQNAVTVFNRPAA